MIPEIAATFGFAAGLVVGLVIAQVREAVNRPFVLPGLRDGEGFRDWSDRTGGEALRRASLKETSPSSKVFTKHESRDTKHGF